MTDQTLSFTLRIMPMKPLSLIKEFSTLLFFALFTLNSSAFAFTNLEGKPDAIENYLGKGKWTIIEIWTSDCHSCRQHMPSMVKFDGTLKNVSILGISLDTTDHVDKAKAFIADFGTNFC